MNLPLLYLAPPLGVTRWNFTDLWHQKTRVPGVVCMILRLAVSVQCQLVSKRQTDGQTDRQTDGRTHDDSI